MVRLGDDGTGGEENVLGSSLKSNTVGHIRLTLMNHLVRSTHELCVPGGVSVIFI